jgi:hypothetical protein
MTTSVDGCLAIERPNEPSAPGVVAVAPEAVLGGDAKKYERMGEVDGETAGAVWTFGGLGVTGVLSGGEFESSEPEEDENETERGRR